MLITWETTIHISDSRTEQRGGIGILVFWELRGENLDDEQHDEMRTVVVLS